jgi:hypothetical protein
MEKWIMPQNLYQSRDLYLSAYLNLNKQRLIGLREDNSIIYFQFEKNSITEKLIIDFFSGTSKVEPNQYVNAIKRLRRLIRNNDELI